MGAAIPASALEILEEKFRFHGDDESGRESVLDYSGFCKLIQELNVKIPTPILRNMYEQVKNTHREGLSFVEFLNFLLDQNRFVHLKEVYSFRIHSREPYGFVMANDKFRSFFFFFFFLNYFYLFCFSFILTDT